jgi:ABC-2 type transport system permease protein
MRKLLAITWKDTLVRFSSPSEWLFFLILPVVFTLILAGGTGGSSDSRLRLVVVDQAHTPLSADLVNTLTRSDAVRPELMTLGQAEDEFNSRRIATLLVIPAGFNLDNLEAGGVELELRQEPNDINALAAAQAINSAISRISGAVAIAQRSVQEAEKIRPFAGEAERTAYFDTSLQAAQAQMSAAPDRLSVVTGATSDQVDYDPRANSSAGQLITWVFVPLIGISGLFASERQEGTLRRLLTTPTRKSTFLLGTITGQVVMALAQMLLLVGFGVLVMKVNWGHSPGALALILVCAALAAAALGTTLGTFVRTPGQASGLSIMLGMSMALLGGCWYPIELFPTFVQTAVKILPTTWAMQGMLDLVLRGQGLSAVLPEAAVLVGFAVVFFTVGVWRFRYE